MRSLIVFVRTRWATVTVDGLLFTFDGGITSHPSCPRRHHAAGAPVADVSVIFRLMAATTPSTMPRAWVIRHVPLLASRWAAGGCPAEVTTYSPVVRSSAR